MLRYSVCVKSSVRGVDHSGIPRNWLSCVLTFVNNSIRFSRLIILMFEGFALLVKDIACMIVGALVERDGSEESS